MKPFLGKIDKQETKKTVINNLEFVRCHVNSNSFEEYNKIKERAIVLDTLKITTFDVDGREELLDFLPTYTRSIIATSNIPIQKNARDIEMLNAIEKKDKAQENSKNRDAFVKWILDGISNLDVRKRKIVIDKYLLKLSNEVIQKRNDIAPRTLTRYLNDAYLDLAIIWQIEIYK